MIDCSGQSTSRDNLKRLPHGRPQTPRGLEPVHLWRCPPIESAFAGRFIEFVKHQLRIEGCLAPSVSKDWGSKSEIFTVHARRICVE